MKNFEVALQLCGNAAAYAKGANTGDVKDMKWRMDVVMANLEMISELLNNPNAENEKYDWDDFK